MSKSAKRLLPIALTLPVYALLRHARRGRCGSRYHQTYFTYKIKYLIYLPYLMGAEGCDQ